MENAPGSMLVISGPSGCGKSTICRRLLEDERVVGIITKIDLIDYLARRAS